MMRRMLSAGVMAVSMCVFSCGTPLMVLAQKAETPAATAPAAAVDPSQMTFVELTALRSIGQQMQQNDQERQQILQALHRAEADVEAAHPGYMLDERSGTLMKRPEPAKAPAKDAKK